MTETAPPPAANTNAARTPTGEIKDVTTLIPEVKTEEKVETKTLETKPDTKPEPKAEEKTEDKGKEKSLLNKDEKKDEAKKPEGAPEKYEAFKVPEGVALDEKVLTEAAALFKGANLSQAQAQQMVDFQAAKLLEAAEAPGKAYLEMRKDWQKEVMDDPKLGPRIAEVKANFSRALDTLGDPALKAAFQETMDLTGAGDNPAFVKVWDAISQRLIEGKSVKGSGPSPHGQTKPGEGSKSAAQAIYSNLPSAG